MDDDDHSPLPPPDRLDLDGPERTLVERPGVKVTWFYDAEQQAYVMKTAQNVKPVLDQNQRDQADANGKPSGDIWPAARIPVSLVYEWMQQGIDVYNRDHWPAVRRKLNDLDHAKLRTGSRFRL